MIANIISSEPFWTVVTGVIVFAFCQLIMEVYVKPRQKLKDIKRRVSYNLLMYEDVYNGQETIDIRDRSKIAQESRGLAADLLSCIEIMPGSIGIFEKTNKRALAHAAKSMKILSEYILNQDDQDSVKLIESIRKDLKLYPLP